MTDKKSNKISLLLIFLTVFIDLVGFGIVIPVLPTCAQKFGASPETVGLLLASYSLMQLLLNPVWGRLSDNIGRRPVLLISLSASAIGYLIWGLADSLALLFISRLVAGAGNANIAVAQAYISDVTTEENRAKGMGLIGAAFGLGFVLGPAIGALICQFGGDMHMLGFAAAALSAFDLLLTAFKLPEPTDRSQAAHERYSKEPNFYWQTLTNKELIAPLLIFFLATFAFANMETTLVLLTEYWYKFNQADNGIMFSYIGLVMVFVQGGLIRSLSKKFPEKRLIAVGSIISALGLISIVLFKSVTGLYLSLGILAIGSGINSPSYQSLLSKLADPKKVGGILGIGQSLSTLGRILGPLVGGFLFQRVGVESPYYLGAAVMVMVFLIALGLPSLQKKGEKEDSRKNLSEVSASS